MNRLLASTLLLTSVAGHKGKGGHEWRARLDTALAPLGIAVQHAPEAEGSSRASWWRTGAGDASSPISLALAADYSSATVTCRASSPAATSASDTIVVLSRFDDVSNAPLIAHCGDDASYLTSGSATVTVAFPAPLALGASVKALLLVTPPAESLTVANVANVAPPPAVGVVAKMWAAFQPAPAVAGSAATPALGAPVASSEPATAAVASGSSAAQFAIGGFAHVRVGGEPEGDRKWGKDGSKDATVGALRGSHHDSSSGSASASAGGSDGAKDLHLNSFRSLNILPQQTNNSAADALAEKEADEKFATADADVAQVIAFVGAALLVRMANKHARGEEGW